MPDRAQYEEARRQVVSFTFYKVRPEWRRLQAAEKQEYRREFGAALARWADSDEMSVLTYSTVGLRADCHMMLWRVCYSLEQLQTMQAELLKTRFGGYIEPAHSFIGMTRRSQYKIGQDHYRQAEAGVLKCGVHKYLTVHPFVKTRNWYQLPFEERQRIVGEWIRVGADFPRVHVNAIYSFGLDDQEFMVVLESDFPSDIIDLTIRLRETQNSMYTLRDTPVLTAVQCSVQEMLERIG